MRLQPAWSPASPRGLITGCRACRAERDSWRPQADDTRGLGFAFDFRFCPAGLTRRALLLFLTSPPRFHDGGVRSGTFRAAPFACPGWPAGHPRSARVHSDRARSGLCVGVVRAVGRECASIPGIARRANAHYWLTTTARTNRTVPPRTGRSVSGATTMCPGRPAGVAPRSGPPDLDKTSTRQDPAPVRKTGRTNPRGYLLLS